MSDNRKYYYLKLKENFYNSETMVILESMQDGLLYSNLLLKMYLMSLKSGGILMLNDHLPHTPQTIATFTRHQVGTVERALKVFLEFGLVEILTDGAYYMADIQLLIGQSSTEGERKKKERMRLKRQKLLPSGGADICPPYSQGDICPPEIRDKRLDNIYSSVKPERAKFKYSEKDMKLAEKLKELVSNLYPQTAEKANLESWANQFRLLHESDGYNYREIGEVMLWALNDDFWQKNIRSADKFRKQFEQLKVKSGINIKQPKQNDSQEIDGDFSDIDPMNMQDMFKNRF